VTSTLNDLVTRSPQRLSADPARVITQLFIPGQEGFDHQDSRTGEVLARILALSEREVASALDDVITRFTGILSASSAGIPLKSLIVWTPVPRSPTSE
jgi:hypothetical protein